MKKGFGRIITMLRKEKGISQCQAAKDLGVSQALMSHYENGIRECSLEFVVKIADYYSVSCDYLLGRSANRNGGAVYQEEPDEKDSFQDSKPKISVIHALNRKIITDSVSILYEALPQLNSKAVSADVTSYFTASVYKIYRMLYDLYVPGTGKIFSIPSEMFEGYCNSIMEMSCAKIKYESKFYQKNSQENGGKKHQNLINPESISEVYPEQYTSLSNLIQNAERKMNYKIK